MVYPADFTSIPSAPTSGALGATTPKQSELADMQSAAIERLEVVLGLDPAGAEADVAARLAAIEAAATAMGIDVTALDSAVSALSPKAYVKDVVADFGAVVDGTTDDTAAWQAALDWAGTVGGVIECSKAGVSVIGGALQDTSNANAQLLVPDVHMLDDKQIGITIRGPFEQSSVVSVVGAAVVPTSGLVLKSTLASGSGAVLGAYGSGTSYQHFTFVHLTLENVTIRTVANPTISGLDLRRVDSCTLTDVIVDTGQYDTTLTEPTTSTSFGVRLPSINNGAHIRADGLHVYGFYNGIEFSEHAELTSVSVGGCNTGLVAVAANHSSHIGRVLVGYCKYGMRFTGAHAVDVEQWAVEHAASGWYATTYDIDDASNYGKGFVRWWAVLQGSGAHNSFTVNSATGMSTSRLGAAIGSGSSSLTVQDENSNVSTSVSQIDFQGAGVTATSGSGEVVVTIPGGTGYVYRDRLTATGGETILTLGATPVANSPLVWVNNTIKWPTTDYTVSSNVLTFGSALSASDVVLVQYHSAASSASAATLTLPAVNIVDNFNRADSTTTLGSTSTGSKAWTADAGTWGISSNTAYVKAGSASIVNRATVNAAVTDCTLSTKISLSGTIAPSGFVVRSDGSGNYYLVEVTMDSSTTPKIYKGVAGSNTTIATGAAINIPAGSTITCEVVGNTITAKYAGATIVSVTDSSYSSNTRFGLYTQAASGGTGQMRFDDFSIQP